VPVRTPSEAKKEYRCTGQLRYLILQLMPVLSLARRLTVPFPCLGRRRNYRVDIFECLGGKYISTWKQTMASLAGPKSPGHLLHRYIIGDMCGDEQSTPGARHRSQEGTVDCACSHCIPALYGPIRFVAASSPSPRVSNLQWRLARRAPPHPDFNTSTSHTHPSPPSTHSAAACTIPSSALTSVDRFQKYFSPPVTSC
jgi:hypothetical protein